MGRRSPTCRHNVVRRTFADVHSDVVTDRDGPRRIDADVVAFDSVFGGTGSLD